MRVKGSLLRGVPRRVVRFAVFEKDAFLSSLEEELNGAKLLREYGGRGSKSASPQKRKIDDTSSSGSRDGNPPTESEDEFVPHKRAKLLEDHDDMDSRHEATIIDEAELDNWGPPTLDEWYADNVEKTDAERGRTRHRTPQTGKRASQTPRRDGWGVDADGANSGQPLAVTRPGVISDGSLLPGDFPIFSSRHLSSPNLERFGSK